MLKKIFALSLFLGLLLPLASFAQVAPQSVSITSQDGLELQADFYPPQTDEPTPAVILLPMLTGTRADWSPLIPVLLDAGLAVLAVDMRGNGGTGGSHDWVAAEVDVQTLIDWLRTQENIAGISLVGGSIGSNLALRGMANDPEIMTAVALSPGLNYRNVTTEDAVLTIGERPIMLVAARQDSPSGQDTATLFALTQGEAQIRLYTGRTHGTRLLTDNPALLDEIVAWVVEHSHRDF